VGALILISGTHHSSAVTPHTKTPPKTKNKKKKKRKKKKAKIINYNTLTALTHVCGINN
jgi:hypothetical protein